MRLPLATVLTSAVLLAAPLAAVPAVPASAAPAAEPAAQVAARAGARTVTHTDWDSTTQLRKGRASGVKVRAGRLELAKPAGTRRYAGRSYDLGRWTSPWAKPGFGLTQLIASWSAITPGDSWIEVRVRGKNAAGARSSWDVLGRWTSGDRFTKRTSVSGQDDDLASVNVDTWVASAPAGLTSWQLQVVLHRKTGATTKPPSIDAIGAVASRLPTTAPATSAPGVARGVVLDVPRYSQMTHQGHYPQWGNGGEAWCSPTSTSMVLGYYRSLPKAKDYSWVAQRHTDPVVDHAARSTYDRAYRGTGNWPFNTAYAAPLAGHAFVTRLTSLRQAERLIKAGIPVVASISFGRGDLTGAPISSTNGHLLVIVGFTAAGDVVVNDPAAPTRATVRRTYDRGEFERAWLPTSGGLAYVIHDDEHPLPAGAQGAW
ncbi:peptidase C39 family protein [Nocardioides sp. W7]|uniref:peptidase C39 family protein n=1 Tax=Nocardioides sp. W7 TaxID=2931390 RepID=UPI001FD272A5|nr:peptidase C39 family protein [Nocardioides sp. W7]